MNYFGRLLQQSGVTFDNRATERDSGASSRDQFEVHGRGDQSILTNRSVVEEVDAVRMVRMQGSASRDAQPVVPAALVHWPTHSTTTASESHASSHLAVGTLSYRDAARTWPDNLSGDTASHAEHTQLRSNAVTPEAHRVTTDERAASRGAPFYDIEIDDDGSSTPDLATTTAASPMSPSVADVRAWVAATPAPDEQVFAGDLRVTVPSVARHQDVRAIERPARVRAAESSALQPRITIGTIEVVFEEPVTAPSGASQLLKPSGPSRSEQAAAARRFARHQLRG